MLVADFRDYGIFVPSASGPEVSTTCPKCSHDRRKKNIKCLSVNIVKGAWHCNHCGWSGGLPDRPIQRGPRPEYRKPDPTPRATLSQSVIEWFQNRRIKKEILIRNKIESAKVFFPQIQAEAEAAVFPYFKNGELINRKYRAIDGKYFRMESGCELAFYGLDDIDSSKPLAFSEGELDKLALETAGCVNVVSVPNGAPAPNAKNYENLFLFLDNAIDKIEPIEKYILAVDSDDPGMHLEAELARRLGPEKCWRTRWPEGTKDANDVLMKYDAEELAWYVNHAEEFPVEGTFRVSQLRKNIDVFYNQGIERGKPTGWLELDEFYTVRPGELTVIIGIPGSGKTNFVDALTVNLARLHDWKFALFSPENLPLEHHMAAMIEKRAVKSFYGQYKMSMTELDAASDWVNDHFFWIMPNESEQWTLDKILSAAEKLCLRFGIRGLVIDPWNELESLRPASMSETEYIGHCLKRIRLFARTRAIHVWVIVHPAKLYRDKSGKYPIPTLYDASGSSHFRNKSDNGIAIWRDLAENDSSEVQIHVQKIRFRYVGHRGMVKLYYDPSCAVYRDGERFVQKLVGRTDNNNEWM